MSRNAIDLAMTSFSPYLSVFILHCLQQILRRIGGNLVFLIFFYHRAAEFNVIDVAGYNIGISA